MEHILLMFLIFAQTKWQPRDAAVLCKNVKDRPLCEQLVAIENRDQDVRSRWIATGMKDDAIRDEMIRIDKENLAAIEQIFAKNGYPGKSLVGQAAAVGWMVIQHSDLDAQKKYIDLLQRAADAGELSPSLVATLVDRIRVREGKPQLYGTQFHEMNGVMVPQPIEDEANVDERRAKAGSTTLAQYTTDLARTYGKPASTSAVIARVWRGRVAAARADEYAKSIEQDVKTIAATTGNLGAQMFRRLDGDVVEFVVTTYWPSLAAVRAFAGADITKAKLSAVDREFLLNPDEPVVHYEVEAEQWPGGKK